MRFLRWNSWCAILAYLATVVYVWFPGPYQMAIFTFIAQPLFVIAGGSYLIQVFRDLRRRQVL